MKNLMRFSAALMFGALIFTACTPSETTLTVPADATIDLGDDFDPMTGVTVDGGDIDDVTATWNPQFNKNLVDKYVITYAISGESKTRNLFVRADKLAKTYTVTDLDNNGTTYTPYPVSVSRGTEYNELNFNELWFDDVVIHGTITGNVLTIPSQTVSGVVVSGTGTYNGETQKILTITYNVDGTAGTSTFSL